MAKKLFPYRIQVEASWVELIMRLVHHVVCVHVNPLECKSLEVTLNNVKPVTGKEALIIYKAHLKMVTSLNYVVRAHV